MHFRRLFLRIVPLIAISLIAFGLLLGYADRSARTVRPVEAFQRRDAVFVGVALLAHAGHADRVGRLDPRRAGDHRTHGGQPRDPGRDHATIPTGEYKRIILPGREWQLLAEPRLLSKVSRRSLREQ